MRVACILVHNLPVQVAIASDPGLCGQPVVLGGLPFEGKTVYDASPEAVAYGIKPGMELHEAYAFCPEARFLPADDKSYDSAFEKVTTILERFSPLVDVECLGCAYIDISGVQNEDKLSKEILADISAECQLSGCLAVSGGKFFSRIAAVTSGTEVPVIVPRGKEKDFVAPFSVQFLPCTGETKERLNRLCVRFIGQLTEYSRESLAAQFGADGVEMHRLACGIDRSPLVPRAKSEVVADSVEFDSPATSLIEILQTSETMLGKLLEMVNAQGKMCRDVLIRLSFTSGTSEERRLPLKEPTNSSAVILGRLQTWLEAIRFSAPAEEIHLSLSLTRDQGKKLSLWPEQKRVKQELTRAAYELKLRFGYQPIKKAQTVSPEPILPERKFKFTEVLE